MSKFERATICGFENVIPTYGGWVDDREIVGLFKSEADVYHDDPDSVATAVVNVSELTPEQREMAERNSEAI